MVYVVHDDAEFWGSDLVDHADTGFGVLQDRDQVGFHDGGDAVGFQAFGDFGQRFDEQVPGGIGVVVAMGGPAAGGVAAAGADEEVLGFEGGGYGGGVDDLLNGESTRSGFGVEEAFFVGDGHLGEGDAVVGEEFLFVINVGVLNTTRFFAREMEAGAGEAEVGYCFEVLLGVGAEVAGEHAYDA